MQAKDIVSKHIETARGEKIINANLSAGVDLVPAARCEGGQQRKPFVLITGSDPAADG